MSERPVFVVGYQRSGTTLLQALLGAHPRIAAPPETYFLTRIVNLRDHYGDLRDDANLRRALHDALNPPVPLFDASGFDAERIFDRLRDGERSYRALVDAVMSDFAERHGKARWCDKTPGQRARGVLKLFPDAQVVHIVRDPRDVIASSLETPWTKAGAGELARAWRRFTLDNVDAGRRAGPEGFHQVRYEDLTVDPEGILRGICAFLGEEFDPGMITEPERRRPTVAASAAPWQSRALGAITPAQPGGWRTRLRPAQAARVSAVLRREIAMLGYEPSSAGSIAAGRILELAWLPARVAAMRERARLRRLARDPDARYREVQRFLREQSSHVAPGAARRG